MNRLTPWLVDNFELIHWLVLIFVGGTLNAFAVQTVANYYFGYLNAPGAPVITSTNWPIYLVLPFVLLFFTPILLSLALTRFEPERQIVPPFHMQVIQLAWFIGFIRFNLAFIAGLIVDVYYVMIGGIIQDEVAKRILGIHADPKDMLGISVIVDAEPTKVRDLLSTEVYRKRLKIGEWFEEESTNTIYFPNISGADYSFGFELRPYGDSLKTLLNMVAYKKRRYYVPPPDDDLKEYVHLKMVDLKDILQRNPHSFSVEDSSDATLSWAFASLLAESLHGVTSRFGRLTGLGKVKMAAFSITAVLAAVEAFVLHSYDSAIGIVALTLLYVAFELRSTVRRRRR